MPLKLHVHDCLACEWLGSFDGYDLYSHGTTVIARNGDDGAAYLSMDTEDRVETSSPHLREAIRRYKHGCEMVLTPR